MIYEYNGCEFHGHPEGTEEEDWVSFSYTTIKEAFEQWEVRKKYLQERIYSLEVKWACELIEERKDPFI